MNNPEFAKCPTAWILKAGDETSDPLDGLRAFSVKEVGVGIAALKIYIAIVLKANFNPNKEFALAGCARISFTQFSEQLDISRAMVAQGLKKLVAENLVEIVHEANSNVYRLNHYDVLGWGKVPKRHMYSGDRQAGIRKLVLFTLRHRSHLNALKLYLLIIALRDRKLNVTRIKHERIADYTGISKNDIRHAISVLIEFELIDVDRTAAEATKLRPANHYHICGLSRFRPATEEDFPAIVKAPAF